MSDPEPSPEPSGAGGAPRDEHLARFAARARRSAGDTVGCPDPGLLAGLAEARLLEREIEDLTAHLALCEECRTAVVGVACDESAVARPAARRHGRVLRWAAGLAAAAALVAVIVHASRPEPVGTREAVVASARELAAARPDLFGDLDRQIGRRTPSTSVRRGAMVVLAPAGTVLETRPSFRWEAAPGVTRWRVVLRSADGEPIWDAQSASASLDFPAGRAPLEPGVRYICDVSGDGPLGREGTRRAFDVAPVAARAAFEDAVREIDRGAAERLRPLLRAEVALSRGLYAVAQAETEAFLRAAPQDEFGRETLSAVRRMVGAPDPQEGGR